MTFKEITKLAERNGAMAMMNELLKNSIKKNLSFEDINKIGKKCLKEL